jgi:hypothetical protein
MLNCIAQCGRSVDQLPERTPLGVEWKPEWGYLCSPCANEPARVGSRNSQGIVVPEDDENAQDAFESLTIPEFKRGD